MKYIAAYAGTLLVLTALDILWLGVFAKARYEAAIGHLLAPQANLTVAVLFYCLFALGLVVFAVVPNAYTTGWSKTLGSAALFGFFTYMTYDLTNLATLRNWPVSVSVLDITWGVVVSTCAGAGGRLAMHWLGHD